MMTAPDYQKGFIAGFIAASPPPDSETSAETHNRIMTLFTGIQNSYADNITKDIFKETEGYLPSSSSTVTDDLRPLIQAKSDFDHLLQEAQLGYDAKQLSIANEAENEERGKYAAEDTKHPREITQLEAEAAEADTKAQQSRGNLATQSSATEDLKVKKQELNLEISRLRFELSRLLSRSEEMDTQRKILLAKQEKEKLRKEAEVEKTEDSRKTIIEQSAKTEQLDIEKARGLLALTFSLDKTESKDAEIRQLQFKLTVDRQQTQRNERLAKEPEPTSRQQNQPEKEQDITKFRALEERKQKERRKIEAERQRIESEAAKRKKRVEKADAARLREMSKEEGILRKELRMEELVNKYKRIWARK